LAIKDPIFASQGLKYESSIYDVMSFFELTKAELHEFSCDCGGDIENIDMANRIDMLAGA
jgi:hypothetical protein